MTEHIRVGHASRWLLASVASFVTGVSGLLACVVFFFTRSSGQTPWTMVCAFAALALAALVAGRMAKPKNRRSGPSVQAPEANDYSGLPASPGSGPNPVPFVLAGIGIAVSAVLFFIGFFIAVGAAFAGSSVGVCLGVAIAAIGPAFLAASWVMR